MSRQAAPQSAAELMLRARALAGAQVSELARLLGCALPPSRRQAKGFVGQLVELALGADADAYDRPDFVALGIELKTVPVGPNGRPRESTFCCSIRMQEADAACWSGSRLRRRLAQVLWLPVSIAQDRPLGEACFGTPRLWRPSAATLATLAADWHELMGMLGAGQAAALTAHRGTFLQVRPKAADSRQRTWGCDAAGPVRVAPAGFYLRPTFVARILAGEAGV